ncbi:MAG: hypothetical protein ABIJ27_00610 [Candidatus Omnitrophota bacterium]
MKSIAFVLRAVSIFLLMSTAIAPLSFTEEESKARVMDVFLHTVNLDDLHETLVIGSDDLKEGMIKIEGKTTQKVRRVLVSLNGGTSWVVARGSGGYGAEIWSYRFTPSPRKIYDIRLKPYDTRGNAGDVMSIKLLYDGRTQEEIIASLMDEIEALYNEKDYDGLMALINPEKFNRFKEFKDELRDTFENCVNLELNLRTRKVSITQDVAIVRVNWERTWEDQSVLEGWGDTIALSRRPNWRFADLSKRSMFIRGYGTVKVKITAS